jgi:hypothetical protein
MLSTTIRRTRTTPITAGNAAEVATEGAYARREVSRSAYQSFLQARTKREPARRIYIDR